MVKEQMPFCTAGTDPEARAAAFKSTAKARAKRKWFGLFKYAGWKECKAPPDEEPGK